MQKHQRDWETRLGALLAKYRGQTSQVTVAQLVSELAGRKITQGLISELERGNRWGGNIDLIGPFARVLNIPTEEAQAIVGLPVDVAAERPQEKTFPEIVAQDPTLSPAAKNHLLNQYELLQMATEHERAGQRVFHDLPASDDQHHERGA